MPTIDLPDDELAAVTAALRGAIESDSIRARRASIHLGRRWRGSLEPTPHPKSSSPEAHKRVRRNGRNVGGN